MLTSFSKNPTCSDDLSNPVDWDVQLQPAVETQLPVHDDGSINIVFIIITIIIIITTTIIIL